MFFINVHELKLKILILFVALINDSDVFLMGCSSMELSSWKGRPLLYLSDPRTCRFSRSPGHCLPKWSLAVLWHFSRKNVIWRERQLLLVQRIGFLHWCHTLCNCVLKCAKFCLAPLPLHFSRTHGEPQEAQGGHCQWQFYWISSILSFGCIILGLCGY